MIKIHLVPWMYIPIVLSAKGNFSSSLLLANISSMGRKEMRSLNLDRLISQSSQQLSLQITDKFNSLYIARWRLEEDKHVYMWYYTLYTMYGVSWRTTCTSMGMRVHLQCMRPAHEIHGTKSKLWSHWNHIVLRKCVDVQLSSLWYYMSVYFLQRTCMS